MTRKTEIMLRLKYLLQLVSATVTLGLSFNATSAHALDLSLFGNPSIRDNGFGDTCTDLSRICFQKPKNVNPNPNLFTSGTISARVTSYLSGSTRININVLQLSGLNAQNGSSPFITNNFITFTQDFTSSLTSGNIFAYQFLQGQFNQGGSNEVRFRVTVNSVPITDYLTSSPLPTRPSYAFNPSPASKFIGTGFSARVIGQLNRLSLTANSSLGLGAGSTVTQVSQVSRSSQGNSKGVGACIVVADRDIDEDVARSFCRVPEPSSTLSLLAFGVLGGGFLLKRREKLSDS
jgi:hypothetical protein